MSRETNVSDHVAADHADYENAFEQTGYGRLNILATLACSLIFVHSLIEMVGIAYTITPAECDLKLTVGQKSMVNSAVFLGIMMTAVFWGLLGDHIGRRKIMLPAVIATVIASFLSSLCTEFWMMFLCRLVTGCLVSASSAVVLVYLAEMQNDAHRDKCLSIAITAAQFSFIIIPAIAWLVIPRSWLLVIGSIEIRSWRIFMWLWGLVGLAGASILFILPESPRFILAVHGPLMALPILARIYAWNFRTSADNYPIKNIDVKNFTEEEKRGILKELSVLMKAPVRRCVILTHVGMFVTFLLSNGLYIWLPDFMNTALSKADQYINMCNLIQDKYIATNIDLLLHEIPVTLQLDDPSDCSSDDVNWIIYPMTMGMELLYLFPFITMIMLINKYSKVWLFAIIMCICSTGLLLSSLVPQCMVAMGFLVIGLAGGSCCCLLTALAVEAFPTSLRSIATCTMYMAGQMGAIVGTSLVGFMGGFFCHIIFVLLSMCTAGAAFALIFFWPNIEDVREEMESKNFIY